MNDIEQRLTGLEKKVQDRSWLERVIALVAALAAVAAALFAYWATNDAHIQSGQAVATEVRTVSENILTRFDSDDMWRARLTLARYHELVGARGPELIKTTRQFFMIHVYKKKLPAGEIEPDSRAIADGKSACEVFEEIDKSRRRIKNFYQDIQLLSDKCLINSAVRIKLLSERFYPNAAKFLEEYWLPVERGQNGAVSTDVKLADDRACDLVNWYKANSTSAISAEAPCTPKSNEEPLKGCAD